jgi:DNA-directed RNA polymerase subunit alpha
MNVKRIRIHSQSERTGKMRLEVTGEGRVCAGDISTSADFEIVNPELHLATLDAADSTLSIEFNVEPGIGYQPAVQSEGVTGLPVGVLPVDAIFNPVRKVDYHVERTRVGQVTDFERLVLEVWTDGTIAPRDAIREAAETLVNHFFLFSNLNPNVENQQDRPSLTVTPEVYQTPIERLELSPRTLNCLKRAHITKVGEVLEMSDDELLKIRNFGDKSLEELREKLVQRGITAPGKEFVDGSETLGALPGLSSQDLGELMGIGEAPPPPVARSVDLPEEPEEEEDLADWPSEVSADEDEEDEL